MTNNELKSIIKTHEFATTTTLVVETLTSVGALEQRAVKEPVEFWYLVK